MVEESGKTAEKGGETGDEQYPAEVLGRGGDDERVWRSMPWERAKLREKARILVEAAETRKKALEIERGEIAEEWLKRTGEPYPEGIDSAKQPKRAHHFREASDLMLQIRRGHAFGHNLMFGPLEASLSEHLRFFKRFENERVLTLAEATEEARKADEARIAEIRRKEAARKVIEENPELLAKLIEKAAADGSG